MPGGKSYINTNLPDLQNFISRRKISLDNWLVLNKITTPESFKALLESKTWHISPELHILISELITTIPVAVKTNLLTEKQPKLLAIDEQPLVVSPVIITTETTKEIKEETISLTKEIVSQSTDTPASLETKDSSLEISIISTPEELSSSSETSTHLSSFKERKRNR